MANNDRLTKRVKKMEEWVAENEDMGGPKGYLDTFVSMYQINANQGAQLRQTQEAFKTLRNLIFGFMQENDMEKEWDKYVEEEQNAVQKSETEEVPVQEQTESSEETSETPKQEKE